jgi:ABC-type glycerol-3-phosphate transport system substrate-binding protein
MTACSSGGSGTATTAAKAATTAAKATTAAPATAKATAAAAKAAATTAAAGQASSQKRSKLKLYLWSSSADTLKKSGVIEDFQSKYPYDVEVTTSEFDSLENTALMMHTTGQDCDVLQVNNSSVATFVEAGMLENLDDWIKSSKLDLSSYAQAAVDIGMVDGKHYSLPYDVDCRILAYNKNILKECGMTEKDLATTDGVLAFGKTANQKGYYAMAGQVSKNVFCIYDLGGFMLCWGVRLYEKDGNNYKSQLTKPEVADYMKWAVEMYQYMPKDTNIDDTMARSMFAEGKVAMLWWTPSQVKSVLPKFKNPDDVGFLTMPKAPNGKSGSAMGGYLFGVSQNAPNKNAAHAWMEYVNKPENMAKITRGLPADTKAFDFKPYNDKLYEKFKEQYKTATFPVPLTPIYTEVAETWNTLYDKALMKEISIEDAIKQGDKAVQDKLDTLKK